MLGSETEAVLGSETEAAEKKLRGSGTETRRGVVMKDENELRLRMLDEEEKIFDRSAYNLAFPETTVSCSSPVVLFKDAFMVSSLILEKKQTKECQYFVVESVLD